VLKVVYGTSARVTLVDGDDILWTCTRGGVAARLAIRHLTLFGAAETDRATTSLSTPTKAALVFWRPQRRAIVDEFTTALLDEAAFHLKDSQAQKRRTPLVPLPIRDMSFEAALVFQRVRSLVESRPKQLENGNHLGIAVVASSLTHAIQMSINSTLPRLKNDGSVQNDFERLLNDAEQRAFGSGSIKPATGALAVPRSARSTTVWAARRIDTDLSRQFLIANDSHDELVQKLAGLDVSDTCIDAGERRFFYCPVGDTLNSVPSRVPFMVDELGKRPVQLRLVETQAQNMVFRPLARFDDQTTDLVILANVLPSSKNVTGLSRHPLIIEQLGTTIHTTLSGSYVPKIDPDEKKTATSTLIDAMLQLKTVDPLAIHAATTRMRSIAFNADRLFCALSLASVMNACQPAVQLVFEGDAAMNREFVVSLVLALAMLRANTTVIPTDIAVYVEDADDMRAYATSIAAQAGYSAHDIVACTLAEAALAIG
jgi:hypothetical protein